MKILFVSYYFPPKIIGGGEQSAYYISRGLQESGHSIKLVTSREVSGVDSKFDVFQLKSFYFRPISHFITEFYQPRVIAQEICDNLNMEDVDIIHAHDLYSLLVISEIKKILLKQNSKKYPKFVFTVRDYLVLCALGALLTKDCNEVCKKCSFSNLMNCLSLKKKGAIIKCGVLIFPSLVRKRKESFSLMDGVIYISQHIRNVFESRIKYNGSTAVIYNPFPPEWFFGRQLEKEKRSIIYVGRMEEHKGVLLLLRALGYLLKKYPDLHIYFIGEGREKARYMKLAKEYGIEKQVDFTGWLSLQIVMSMYRKASIAVIPSLWNEPFGRVAIEAMASRCIVIVPNSGSFTELIKEGENGYLFVHGDEKSLLNKLERIIENEENLGIIRENAFTYSKGFSIEKSAKEHINFYSGLII